MNYQDLPARVHWQWTRNFNITQGDENFEFTVSELVQVNPDNSQAMSELTFSLFKLNRRLQKNSVLNCIVILAK